MDQKVVSKVMSALASKRCQKCKHRAHKRICTKIVERRKDGNHAFCGCEES
jgi:hypothetical protein